MNHEDNNTKIKTVNGWENLDMSQLHSLFENYLYPLIKWHKRNHGLGYSSKTIALFKGIKNTLTHNHAIYHKSSHLYLEQLNSNMTYEIFSSHQLNQFQLTQPLIAGKRFFNYVQHYHNLLEQIEVIIKIKHKDGELPNSGSGDSYTKQLYKCSLMFFADRFGLESLTPAIMDRLYSWSYSIRLAMYAVYEQTINKYALGKHDAVNKNIALFYQISEMNEPEELMLITFEQLKKDEKNNKNEDKYSAVLNKINLWNGVNNG